MALNAPEEPLHRGLLDPLYAFAHANLREIWGESAFAQGLVFQRNPRPGLHAHAARLGPTAHLIYLSDGLADAAYAAVEQVGLQSSDLAQTHFSEMAEALGDHNAGFSHILLSSLTFFLFHEIAHAAAGHLDFERDAYGLQPDPDTSYEMRHTARPSQSGPLAYGDYIKMSELEADGVAFELLLTHAHGLADMVCDTAPDDHPALLRSAALGGFIAMHLLDRAFATQARDLYPDPQARLLNACSAAFRYAAPIDTFKRTGPELRKRAFTEDEAAQTVQFYIAAIMPALFMLHDLAEAEGGGLTFLPQGKATTQAMLAGPLLGDLRKVLATADREFETPAGKALDQLAQRRPDFMEHLQPFRKTDWWTPW